MASAQDTETELLDGVPGNVLVTREPNLTSVAVSLQADSGTMTYYKVTPTGTSSLLTITATAISKIDTLHAQTACFLY